MGRQLSAGGEYGGAAVSVAEHAPEGRRGLCTSRIQTTTTLGLFLSLIVILVCRLLLGISVAIRLQLEKSPVFVEIRREGRLSAARLTGVIGALFLPETAGRKRRGTVSVAHPASGA